MKGIGDKIAQKFEKSGITEIEQFFLYPPPFMAEMLGIDNDSANELYKKARVAYNDTIELKDALDALEDDKNIDKISTGTNALDKLFTGGIECRATTEIYGEFGCGKTQFAHTMAVRVQLPVEEGGLDGKAIYIDTEGTFEPTRIVSIAENLNMDIDKVLKNILTAKVRNTVDQFTVIGMIGKMLTEDKSIKLLVIDSAIGLFRSQFKGRAMLSERQKYLNEFLEVCDNIADFYNIAVIWTNQVMINPGQFFGDPITAIGGTILAHRSTYRVYFKKSGAYRMAKMVDSPKHAETEVMFGLSIAGVVDKEVKEELEKKRKAEKLKAKKAEKKEEE